MKKRHRDATLLALNVERGDLEARNMEGSRSWKGRRNGFPGKEHCPADTLIIAQQDPRWTSSLQNCKIKIYVVSAAKFVVVCYRRI